MSKVAVVNGKLTCPSGHLMVLRTGRYGKFYGCSSYPKCKETCDWDIAQRLMEQYRSGTSEKPREFKPSEYQLAVFDFITNSKGNAVVEAVAGSGKTTTIVKALELTPKGEKVLFCAFNKHIARELSQRAPAHVRVGTLHSIGFSALKDHLRTKPEVDNNKLWNIVKEVLPFECEHPFRAPLKKLASLAKATLVDATDKEAVEAMATHYGVELNGNNDLLIELLPRVLAMCAERTHIIDFDDMIWMPVLFNLGIEGYDWVFIDECLPYHTPVLLADGSSMSIGDIVENKEPVEVLAYDTNSGEQKHCKVTGWHKILNRKPLVKVRVRHHGKVGNANWPGYFVVCTEDHKIWADKQWTEAGKLKPGMIVQIETAAKKSQKYKIASVGKDTLARVMTAKNEDGRCGGHHPPKGVDPFANGTRGGNGRDLTIPQQVLLEALGEGWAAECAIATGHCRDGSGYPSNYKVDLCHLGFKLAVELDGGGHCNPESLARDDKKDAMLNELGWTVIRINNVHAIQHTDECVDIINAECGNNCPADAVVVSVEPACLNDYYVYDISVEHCHNFYANGILVHNCQDLNASQIELVLRLVNGTGRIIAVGDRKQAIYGFRGADVNAIPNLIEALGATVLPLSITYRCPTSVVELAQKLVPQIKAAEWAKEGIVRDSSYNQMMSEVEDGNLILCRVNAPLVKACYTLIRRGTKAVIRGRDIGRSLQALIDKLKPGDIHDLLAKIREYKWEQSEKLRVAGKEDRIESLVDRCDTLEALCDGIRDLSELRHKIDEIFNDVQKAGVILSSVHRAKGDESERVYILAPELMPHPLAVKPWQLEQEKNIEYVALTRSKHELVFVR